MDKYLKITLEQPLSFHQRGQRPNQEDARFPDTDYPDPASRVFVVCDGVGGREKGEVASQTVARAIGDWTSGMSINHSFGEQTFKEMMVYVYKRLGLVANSENASMATTLTFACFNTSGVFLAYIGDSVICQARPGAGIIFHTVGHSLVNDMVRQGIITPDSAATHPRRNVITRCIRPLSDGAGAQPISTITLTDVKPGDVFMLCSDGVGECFTHEMLAEMLSDPNASLMIKARNIASECAMRCRDNNTGILIGIKAVEETNPLEQVEQGAPEKGRTMAIPPEYQSKLRDVSIDVPSRHASTRGGVPATSPTLKAGVPTSPASWWKRAVARIRTKLKL